MQKENFVSYTLVKNIFLNIADDPKITQFQSALLDDHDTTQEQWDSLISLFQDQGYEEAAMSLLTSVTVLTAMRTTLYTRLHEETPEPTPQTLDSRTTCTEPTVQPDQA